MVPESTKLEKGQSLVLVALLMIAFAAMLALVLEGGYAFLMRRNAQTAADAGALAGARELCLGSTGIAAYNQAQEYACDLNGADLPPATDIDVDATNKRVTVTSSITFQNIFARVLGLPQSTARAGATAGCFKPCFAESVLPVLWSCRPPIEGLSESEDCQQQRITWDQLQGYLVPPRSVHPELYVIMDSFTYEEDLNCIEDDPLTGTIVCDFDDPPDGEADFLASGGRSWTDLDGTNPSKDCGGGNGEGSSELVEWINNGLPCNINTHTWVPDQVGNLTSVYDALYDKWLANDKGLLVLVPVFDSFCPDGYPVNPEISGGACATSNPPLWHTGEDTIKEGSQNQKHFHIIDFAAFYVTCVRKSENFPSESCPGYERFKSINEDTPGITPGNLQSMKSIEGYFIEGIPPDLYGKCEGGVDTGVWTLYLD